MVLSMVLVLKNSVMEELILEITEMVYPTAMGNLKARMEQSILVTLKEVRNMVWEPGPSRLDRRAMMLSFRVNLKMIWPMEKEKNSGAEEFSIKALT